MNRFGHFALAGIAVFVLAVVAVVLFAGFGSDVANQSHQLVEPSISQAPSSPSELSSRAKSEGDRQVRKPESLEVEIDPSVQWTASMTPHDFMELLESHGLLSEGGRNHMLQSWLQTCLDVKAFKMRADSEVGKKLPVQVSSLAKICEGVLPTTLEVENPVDAVALQGSLFELRWNSSLVETRRRLQEQLDSSGKSAMTMEAIEVLREGLDTGALTSSILALLNQGEIESATLQAFESYFWTQDFQSIAEDVSTVLVCDRIGGCFGADHPLVLHRCFQEVFGCGSPVDIYDAIHQQRTPVEYAVFRDLLGEVRQLVRSSSKR